jgi:hypothetical protein
MRRRRPFRTAAALLCTAVLSLGMVVASTHGGSAAPVDRTVRVSCGARGGDPSTAAALDLAASLVGSNKLALNLKITAADLPATAGIGEELDAAFGWRASLDQTLIDGAAGLINSISVSDLKGTMLVTGPSSVASFPGTAPDTSVTPVKGQVANVDLGQVGGPITTTGGGIITYRVGALQFDSSLTVPSIGQSFDLKLSCAVQGSNLIATTTVRDPDAPVFDPEVVQRTARAGETVSVDLLGDVITEGRTPLLADTLRIAEAPAAGEASISDDGVFEFTAPSAPGTYATTIEVCGEPKPDSGIPGTNEVHSMQFGANWAGWGSGGLSPRPIAFTLKVGEEETALIWATDRGLLGVPSPTNWAPEHGDGLVNAYAVFSTYRDPHLAEVRAALESLPSIGAGNVDVTEVREGGRLVGYRATYVGERAEQDIAPISLGQWYSVPPQEVLDRIGAAISEITASLGEDAGVPAEPTPLDGLTPEQADTYIGDKLVASIFGGPEVTDAEWQAWVELRLLDPLVAAVPGIIAFINGLFPAKLAAETATEGESPTPPPPLCAQGIVEVTVAEVASVTTTVDGGAAPSGPAAVPGSAAGNQVAGTSRTRGIGFVG